jgi:hypothetical protein
MITPAEHVAVERRRVLDDLNLSMLFVDAASIDVPECSDGRRHLPVAVRTAHGMPSASAAALLCRLLHHRRIPSIEIDLANGLVRARCRYLLPGAPWSLAVTVAPR